MSRPVKTLKNVIADDTFTIVDYPSCELFFPVTEATITILTDESPANAGGTLTDIVSGVTCEYKDRIDTTGPESGSITYSASTGAVTLAGTSGGEYGEVIAGTMPNLGNTKHPFAVHVADFSQEVQAVITFGGLGGSDDKLSATSNIFLVIADGAANDSVIASLPDANSQAIGMYLDRTAGEFHGIETDGSACVDVGSPDTTIAATGEIDLALNSGALILSSTTVLHGSALFNFTDQPSANDLISIVSWCNYMWRTGNEADKILPPWLKGRI